MTKKATKPLNKNKKIYISVTISDDKELKKLNKKYLNKNETTDVLSFSVEEKLEDGTFYLGDVIVNKQQAKRQAKNYENSLREEISELVAHGILHLLGVHHKGGDH